MGLARARQRQQIEVSLSQGARRSLAMDEASPLRCWPEGQQLCALYTIAARVWLFVGIVLFQVVSATQRKPILPTVVRRLVDVALIFTT